MCPSGPSCQARKIVLNLKTLNLVTMLHSSLVGCLVVGEPVGVVLGRAATETLKGSGRPDYFVFCFVCSNSFSTCLKECQAK